MMKIFFVSDIHASNHCYRKFLNALKIYKVDMGILLGDLTGKLLIPLVEKAGGGWETNFLGNPVEAHTEQELTELKRQIEMVGYYWKQMTPDEFEDLRQHPEKQDALFHELALQRLREWMALADERLAGSGLKLYMAPGNDDVMEVDDIISDSEVIVNCNDRVVMVGEHEMVTFAWANPTPWDTPREKPDEELQPMLEALIAQVKDVKNSIFNLHAPPYGFALDLAPELTKDLIQAVDRKIHVGSRAVANVIQKYQPFLSLHGHIHESRGIQKVGRTTMINPGSEYSEGVLRGVVLQIENGKLKDYIFTSG
ncbi:MAG: phosphoesterase [Anaerolineae bacterium]|nr:phosphoesterase [Anaerolineae bacterium]